MDNFKHNDGRVLRLGKGDKRDDPRNLKFERYQIKGVADPPPAVNWYKSVAQWGMMANDLLGDCTIAAPGHAIQVATVNTGEMVTLSDEQIIHYYESWDGYVPGDPNSDQGGVILDVLNHWRNHRGRKPNGRPKHQGMSGHKLLAFCEVNPLNNRHVKKAIEQLGVLDIGIQLPISAQDQVGRVWDLVGDCKKDPDCFPGSWGGHSVAVAAYDVNGVTVITWGELQVMTWRFWNAYVDECYALLMAAMLDAGLGFTGFDLEQLRVDIGALSN